MTKTKLDRAALNKCTKAQLIAIIEVFVANEQKPEAPTVVCHELTGPMPPLRFPDLPNAFEEVGS